MKTSALGSLWGGPIAMAVLTTTGLATALVSDTWGDWWSWVGLGIPVAVMCWFAWRRPASLASNPAPNLTGEPRADAADANDAAHATEPHHTARPPSL